jgi:hypothetical protein
MHALDINLAPFETTDDGRANRGISVRPKTFFFFAFLCLIATGCFAPSGISNAPGITNSGIPLAPGADQVKLTRNAADIASCKAVGNLSNVKGGNVTDAGQRIARNQAIGLGGNTIFDTSSAFEESQGAVEGIVYRCN